MRPFTKKNILKCWTDLIKKKESFDKLKERLIAFGKSFLRQKVFWKFRKPKTLKSDLLFISNMSHVSDEVKVLCKLLLKKKNIHNTAERQITQNIYFYSARTYIYLRDVLKLKLPSTRTISRWTVLKNMKPGFNTNLLENLKQIVDRMSDLGKEAVLVFDETKIKPGLQYNSSLDEIEGFENNGTKQHGF